MVTIQDVAREAGVSAMTVSHVINNHPHVRDSTRERVREVMNRLEYRVNVAARNLRMGRTGTVGLAVPEIDRPYYGQLAALITDAAARRSLRVVVEQTGRSREKELDALELSRNRMYDGLILSTVGLGPADAELLRTEYPVVLLGERIFDGPADHVAMPNVAGAEAATAHLIAHGRRRIAIVCLDPSGEISASKLRHTGYRAALQTGGLEDDSELVVVVDELTQQAGREAAGQLVASGVVFDAIFAITDTVASGVLRGLADQHIAVPADVLVVGFDNIENDRFTVPSLSSVDPDHAFMAEEAIRLLCDRIEDRTRPHHDVIAPFRVVARESTGGVED